MNSLNLICRKGFTLIEMLIVIALIVIIAGIALPRFGGVTQRARIAKATGELRTAQTALESDMAFGPNPNPPGQNNTRLRLNDPIVRDRLEKANPRIIANVDEFRDPFDGSADPNPHYNYKRNRRFYVVWSLGPTAATNPDPTIDPNTGVVSLLEPDDIAVTNGKRV